MGESKQTMVMDVHDVPRAHRWLMLSLQHLFAMFGATILVPYLIDGLEPAVALITSGLGTLAYLAITRGQIPAYLGSSFAFIAPFIAVIGADGPEAAMFGSFLAGVVYGLVALFIHYLGVDWLKRMLPPVVVGPVIIVIGLGLASVAIDMAMTIPGTDGEYSTLHFTVALVTLTATIVAAIFIKGFFGLIPILIGIIVGYVYAFALGMIDLTPVREAKWLGVPDGLLIPFVTYDPVISWLGIMVIVPVAFVTLAEHIGDQMVLSKLMDRDILKKPGLHRSILGDGVATMIASLLGGPPNTTYGENIGVLTITRVFSSFVIGGAAVLAIMFGFSPKVSELIKTIPSNVMGGVAILLFGVIALQGIRMLIDQRIDFGQKRNLAIASVILITGVGGAFINITENVQVAGMALAAIVGIILNLLLPEA
ncbi:uracil transporter [Caldalkalibacillus thermarum]|nr:solute carrier family 23 protein [Caldalkalibacillus thermarum]GGK13969.1 uracil transporter [Caldalkalibacillus thermarum]